MGMAARVVTLLVVLVNGAFAVAVLNDPKLEAVPGRVRPAAAVLLAVCAVVLGLVARSTIAIIRRRASAGGLGAFPLPLPKMVLFMPLSVVIVAGELSEGRVSQTAGIALCFFTVLALAVFLPQARFAVVGERLLFQPGMSLFAGELRRSEIASFECGPSVMHELSTTTLSRRIIIRTIDGEQFTLHLVGVHAEAAIAFEAAAPRAHPPAANPLELVPLDDPELQRVSRAGNLVTFGFIVTAAAVVTAAVFLIELYKIGTSTGPVRTFESLAALYRLGGPPLVVAAAIAAIGAALGFLGHVRREERKLRASLGEERYWELVLSYEARQPAALRTYGPDRKLTRSVYVVWTLVGVMVCGALVASAFFD